MQHSNLRVIEFSILFIALPLFLWLRPVPTSYLTITLVTITVYALIQVKRGDTKFEFSQLWHPQKQKLEKAVLQRMLTRFIVFGVLMFSLTGLLMPEKFVQLVREQPETWLLMAIVYPVVSVYPQEIIFRLFFFRRYQSLFPNARNMIFASALAFSFLHIIFGNWLALVLSLIGGWFFARTYSESRSLRLAALEHALYGEVILISGLGEYFYYGNWTW